MALDDYLHRLGERYSLDQRIKLIGEQTNQREFLEKTINDLTQQVDGRFAVYSNLSAKSLSELESYVQSDGEETWQEIQDIQKQEQQLSTELDNPKYIGFSELPDDTISILKRLAEEKRNIAELTKQLNDNVNHLTYKPPRWLLMIFLASMSVVGVVLGLAAIFLMKNNYAVGISLTLILFGVISGFIAAILSITQHSRTQR